MPLVLADRVRDTTTTTGTGTITLSGTAPTGFQSFAAIGNGNTTYYTISGGSQWEVGVGTYTAAGNTLARTTVISSSNAGALVNFSAGTKDVFVTYPAGKSVNQDASGNVGIGTTSPSDKLTVDTGHITLSAGYDIKSPDNFALYDTTSSLDRFMFSSNNAYTARSGGAHLFNAAGTELMRLNSTGLGVGITVPAARVHVVNSSIAGQLRLQDVTTDATTKYGTIGAAHYTNAQAPISMMLSAASSGNNAVTIGGGVTSMTAATIVQFYTATNTTTLEGTERMRINSLGNVGIGTGSPNYRLQVEDSQDAHTGVFVRNSNTGTSATGSLFVASAVGNITIRAHSAAHSVFPNATLIASDSTFTDGLNILQAGAAPIKLWTNGTERMRVTSAGRVGIGTTAPGYALDVVGDFRATTDIVGGATIATGNGISTGDVVLELGGLRTGSGNCYIDLHATNGTDFESRLIRYPGANGGMDIINMGTGGMVLSQEGAAPIVFKTTATERMRIDSSGNVGIGTSTATARLRVAAGGTVNAPVLGNVTNYSAFFSNSDTAYGLGIGTNTVDGHVWLQAQRSDTATAYNLTINEAGGNVGIGTSSPAQKLDVSGQLVASGTITVRGNGSEGGQISLTNAASSADVYFFDVDGGGNGRLFTTTNNTSLTIGQLGGTGGSVLFATNAAERMRIDSGGNVGIGTSSPQAKLHVKAATNVNNWITNDGTTLRTLAINDAASSYINWRRDANQHTFETSGAERLRINSAGNVGIGTTGGDFSRTWRLVVRNDQNAETPLGVINAATGANTSAVVARITGTTNSYCNWSLRDNAGAPVDVFDYGAGVSAVTWAFGLVERLRISSTGGVTSADIADAVGYKGIPQNAKTAGYTLALSDMGKHISITTGGVVIPANASVAFDIGSTIAVYNNSASTQTISITTDTLRWAGTTSTGTRTLAPYGLATLIKVAATTWIVSGNVS